ncbi:TPA: hypothetical protein ROY06_004255 [Bacillus cereus]|uniref:hypothetical protein n=1 Tax=Bacillus TaxID=1386 RepID=UPI0003536BBD|nr:MULTISPECIES: hypothetical protein [Bacillus]HDR4895283.1 hypothetical protein [Bacillus cereus]EPF08891.1 hypothetical protein ICA_04992 [Bacillus cereus BAG1O-3]MDR4414386.1 hypothetical protein [Bacillus thuringiensis]PFG78856.1 hypothetical protein DL97_2523 [Bacillus sp. YF23]HDX9510947.1 hypothetical protein [Bacillus cereus]
MNISISSLTNLLPEYLGKAVHESPWELPTNHLLIGIEGAVEASETFFKNEDATLMEFIQFLIEDSYRRNTYYPININVHFEEKTIKLPDNEDEIVEFLIDLAWKSNLFEGAAIINFLRDDPRLDSILLRLAARTDIMTDGHGKELAFAYHKFKNLISEEERWRFLTHTYQAIFKAIFAEMTVSKATWGRTRFLGKQLKPYDMCVIPREELEENDNRTLYELIKDDEGKKAMWYVDEVLDPEDNELQRVCMIRAIESVGSRRHSISSCRAACKLESKVPFIDQIFMWRGILEFFLADSTPIVTKEQFEKMIMREKKVISRDKVFVEDIRNYKKGSKYLMGLSHTLLEQGVSIEIIYTELLKKALEKEKSVHLINIFNAMYLFGEKLGDEYKHIALARCAWETERVLR